MDEISPFASTSVVELKDNIIKKFKIDPRDVGVKFNNTNNLIGKDPDYNAKKIIEIFSGIDNEFSEAVCLNAAAALIVANKYDNLEKAYKFSKKHILSGIALEHLKKNTVLINGKYS